MREQERSARTRMCVYERKRLRERGERECSRREESDGQIVMMPVN